jgi:hypothetical protein
MIVKTFYKQREDGVNLYRTVSDLGLYIIQNESGNIYLEAIDVEDASYTYIELEEDKEIEL